MMSAEDYELWLALKRESRIPPPEPWVASSRVPAAPEALALLEKLRAKKPHNRADWQRYAAKNREKILAKNQVHNRKRRERAKAQTACDKHPRRQA